MSDDESFDAHSRDSKASKRSRLKGAFSRTKNKFKRNEDDEDISDERNPSLHILPDDVNDFLSVGVNRTNTSSSAQRNQSHDSDRLLPHPSSYPTSGGPFDRQSSPQPVASDPSKRASQSPRKFQVPRIDVSNSQRWQGAQPLNFPLEGQTNNLLQPAAREGRSQSVSSLSRGRGRARSRGLGVVFTNSSPVVIGEGGDEAQAPTIEISRAKARARSLSTGRPDPRSVPFLQDAHWSVRSSSHSPIPSSQPVAYQSSVLPPRPLPRQSPSPSPRPAPAHISGESPHSSPGVSPVRRKPVSPTATHQTFAQEFRPKGINRVQTGIDPGLLHPALTVSPLEYRKSLEQEFAMTLQLGTGAAAATVQQHHVESRQKSPPLNTQQSVHPYRPLQRVPDPTRFQAQQQHGPQISHSGNDFRRDIDRHESLPPGNPFMSPVSPIGNHQPSAFPPRPLLDNSFSAGGDVQTNSQPPRRLVESFNPRSTGLRHVEKPVGSWV